MPCSRGMFPARASTPPSSASTEASTESVPPMSSPSSRRTFRFRRPIRAGESAELTVRMNETEVGLLMQAELRVEGAVAAQLRLKEAAL